MKFRTFIDDSTEAGQTTLSGITTQGTTYGVGISSDVDGVRYFESTGIATVSELRVGTGVTSQGGIVTAIGGFLSGVSTDGQLGVSTTPIHITLDGNVLAFTAVGIGSTFFTLA
tara:strand:- start:561 stop:902 length:342 start_codon:yes stop_codon:yes gene_type:complete